MGPPKVILEMDLSQQSGNPAHALQANSKELWAIQDPQELQQRAIEVVKPYVGSGMSNDNYKLFIQRIAKAANRGIFGLQKYLTDFILKADKQGVIYPSGGRGRYSESTLRILANSDAALFNEALRTFGLKIIGRANTDPLQTRIRNEDVVALASMITEDIHTPTELSRPTRIAMEIAEEAGYVVAILDEAEMPDGPMLPDDKPLPEGWKSASQTVKDRVPVKKPKPKLPEGWKSAAETTRDWVQK